MRMLFVESDQTRDNSGYLQLLSLNDTNVLKGFALLLLLWHHLFYVNDGLYDDIHLFNNYSLVQEIGKLSKLCVTLFVMLSGYGLAVVVEQTGGVHNLKGFYFRRFKKLFLNYWLIWGIFVPISIFFFNYTFCDAYKYDVTQQLLLDFLGLHDIFYHYPLMSYNPTWWFYSCIILLYLVFPFLFRWIKKDPLSVVLASIVISFIPISHFAVIQFNILAFVIGIIMVLYKSPPFSYMIYAFLLSLLAILRIINAYPLMFDCFLSTALVQLYRCISIYAPIKQALAFIGRHSMNIFLFHTFIFGIWFQDFIYASRNPIIIFLTLLLLCIPISMLLERIKKYTILRL